MSIIDTSLAIDRVAEGKAIREGITVITAMEYPLILEYKNFYGRIIYPEKKDLDLAVELQSKLGKRGGHERSGRPYNSRDIHKTGRRATDER